MLDDIRKQLEKLPGHQVRLAQHAEKLNDAAQKRLHELLVSVNRQLESQYNPRTVGASRPDDDEPRSREAADFLKQSSLGRNVLAGK